MAPSITAAADACSSKEKETDVTLIPDERRRGDARLKIEKELLQDAGEMQRSQQTAGCSAVRANRVLQAPQAGKKSIRKGTCTIVNSISTGNERKRIRVTVTRRK
ncbi:uncharacterized protein LOC114883189 isoform X2 [Osmia bicornis bicornis]|uniref:uncharacterized protein LOC114883189 isoform X2 n=1 Tax=Osmia bicornis bicornis TaxID=1437191 RepID=UPI001EAEC294|nr:uncharacterized protein LOC114883189 isoform X2 [Osmia bicornis bicornis]XP_029056581.2 uncharacterized protein LOC114883189 isoform X2 [Osmia bicornis bicornis]